MPKDPLLLDEVVIPRMLHLVCSWLWYMESGNRLLVLWMEVEAFTRACGRKSYAWQSARRLLFQYGLNTRIGPENAECVEAPLTQCWLIPRFNFGCVGSHGEKIFQLLFEGFLGAKKRLLDQPESERVEGVGIDD